MWTALVCIGLSVGAIHLLVSIGRISVGVVSVLELGDAWPRKVPSHGVPTPTFRAQTSGQTWGRKGERRCLRFVHIPKTGGTSIEVAMTSAIEADKNDTRLLPWGRFDPLLRCNNETRRWNADRMDIWCRLGGDRDSECPVWHMPPRVEPLVTKYYEECETFCVVRHPVGRMVSEWHFSRFRKGIGSCGSEEEFRSFVAEVLQQARRRPYVRDCHILPQSDFVFAADSERRTCTHVLKYENFQAEFAELMRRYRLPLMLQSHKLKSHCAYSPPADISKNIRAFYESDMTAFGYT
mmetsp:Transcript_29620/g.84475  ORF Transcript_29620/g.84475 Transcript_29620/m.84475 type:complete len:294 (-) Transcript_29620:31-912(-)